LVFDEDTAANPPEEAAKGIEEGTWKPILGADTEHEKPPKPKKEEKGKEEPKAASKQKVEPARLSDLPAHLRPHMRVINRCVPPACKCQSPCKRVPCESSYGLNQE
jgi:hypothetical protein